MLFSIVTVHKFIISYHVLRRMAETVRNMIKFKDGRVDTISDNAAKIVLKKDCDRNMLDYIQGIPIFRVESGVRTFTRTGPDAWAEEGSSVVRKTTQMRKLINDLFLFGWYVNTINDSMFAEDELYFTLNRSPIELRYRLTGEETDRIRFLKWGSDAEEDIRTLYGTIRGILNKNPMTPATLKMPNLHTKDFRIVF